MQSFFINCLLFVYDQLYDGNEAHFTTLYFSYSKEPLLGGVRYYGIRYLTIFGGGETVI